MNVISSPVLLVNLDGSLTSMWHVNKYLEGEQLTAFNCVFTMYIYILEGSHKCCSISDYQIYFSTLKVYVSTETMT